MKLVNSLRFAAFSMIVFACAGVAAAQGPVSNESSTTSELELSATVQTALQLNISTGSGGATVSGSNATGLYSIGFGTINGLGLGTPESGVTVVADGSGALYKTAINLTPIYSGFTSESADITVTQDAAGDTALAREGNGSINSSSIVSTTTPGTVAVGAASGIAIERQVGLYVSRTEEAGVKSATLIYDISMNLD